MERKKKKISKSHFYKLKNSKIYGMKFLKQGNNTRP